MNRGVIMARILLEAVSYRDDGKFIENETDEELSQEEVIEVIQSMWDDLPADYYSWHLRPIDKRKIRDD